jgi:hypothetical protein
VIRLLLLLLLLSSPASAQGVGRQMTFAIMHIPDVQQFELPPDCESSIAWDARRWFFEFPARYKLGHPDFFPGIPIAAAISAGDLTDRGGALYYFARDRGGGSIGRFDCRTDASGSSECNGNYAASCDTRVDAYVDDLILSMQLTADAGVCFVPVQGDHDMGVGSGYNVNEFGVDCANQGDGHGGSQKKYQLPDCESLTDITDVTLMADGSGRRKTDYGGSGFYADLVGRWSSENPSSACGYVSDDAALDMASVSNVWGTGLGANKHLTFVGGGKRHHVFALEIDISDWSRDNWLIPEMASVPVGEGIIAAAHVVLNGKMQDTINQLGRSGTEEATGNPGADVSASNPAFGSTGDDLKALEWLTEFDGRRESWLALGGHYAQGPVQARGGRGYWLDVDGGVVVNDVKDPHVSFSDCGPAGDQPCPFTQIVTDMQAGRNGLDARTAAMIFIYPRKNEICYRSVHVAQDDPQFTTSGETFWNEPSWAEIIAGAAGSVPGSAAAYNDARVRETSWCQDLDWF